MAITSFRGAYGFLSNFYRQPVDYLANTYKSAEHAYQCQKPLTSHDRYLVMITETPAQAKRLANKVARVPNWHDIKVDTMLNILRAKFRIYMPMGTMRNPLSIRLIQTDPSELIEGNTWGDTFWGQCPLGKGENMLGKLLMKVRFEISHATR